MDSSGTEKSLRLLLIEDSEDDAWLVRRALERGGYSLIYERVDNAEAMHAALNRQAWSIVISDHRMPRFSSLEALKLLQSRGLDLPFIIVSGTIGEDVAVGAMKAGAHDYILKDNLARLVPVVERELREAEVRRERRIAETARIESEARLRAVVESAGDAIIITDERGTIELFNPAAAQVFGYAASEALGQNLNILVDSERYRDHNHYLERYYQHGKKVAVGHTRELIGRRKDGSVFPMELTVSEVWMERGRFFTGIVRDITDRKRATSERMQAERLRIEVEKERELIEMRERFVSMVSHDLRTPLTVILSSTEIMMRYLERLTPENQLERIETIYGQAQSMLRMLNDILLLNQVEAGKVEFHPVMLDLEGLCRGIFENIQIGDKIEHEYLFEVEGSLEVVMADEKLVHRILDNLLSNAIKYSPNGGRIHLKLSGLENEIMISVSDNGIGIMPDDFEKLYDAFHRGGNTGKIEGTGLGMTIVKRSVDGHRGLIDFESEVDKGSTFTVRLPRYYDV